MIVLQNSKNMSGTGITRVNTPGIQKGVPYRTQLLLRLCVHIFALFSKNTKRCFHVGTHSCNSGGNVYAKASQGIYHVIDMRRGFRPLATKSVFFRKQQITYRAAAPAGSSRYLWFNASILIEEETVIADLRSWKRRNCISLSVVVYRVMSRQLRLFSQYYFTAAPHFSS